MRDFMLILVVAAAFVYGFYLMKKADTFFGEHYKQNEETPADSQLHITFEKPAGRSGEAFHKNKWKNPKKHSII